MTPSQVQLDGREKDEICDNHSMTLSLQIRGCREPQPHSYSPGVPRPYSRVGDTTNSRNVLND